jgi:hypothetical protein
MNITAWNADELRRPNVRNPISLAHANVTNTADQFVAFLNRLQVHSTCRVPYCLQPKRGSKAPPSCRIFFPRPLFPDPVVTQEINHKGWLLSPARNQANLNQCTPLLTVGWMANTDIQPPTSFHAVLSYIDKYVSKLEKSSAPVRRRCRTLPRTDTRGSSSCYGSILLNYLLLYYIYFYNFDREGLGGGDVYILYACC